ncbi:MAG: ATP synthase F1 subunit delta [Eggerthellales bacterium]|nr:ATP synthase F1 subunit delta [Eggerthellales bacterium]
MPNNRHLEQGKVLTYASVLLDSALEAGGQDAVLEVRDQFETIVKIVRSNMDLAGALSDNSADPAQRASIARGTFAMCNLALCEVLAVMAERGDMSLMNRIYASFVEQLERKLNVAIVDVTTVVALDDHLREVITNKVEADLGTKVVLRERIDKSLLGGILLTVGGKRIDASVASRLDAARTALKETSDGGEC